MAEKNFRTNGDWGTVAHFGDDDTDYYDDDNDDDNAAVVGVTDDGDDHYNYGQVPAVVDVPTAAAATAPTMHTTAVAYDNAAAHTRQQQQQQQQQQVPFVQLTQQRRIGDVLGDGDASAKRRRRPRAAHVAAAPDSWNVQMVFNLGVAARVAGGVGVFVLLCVLIAVAQFSSRDAEAWSAWNGDTLATRFSNIMLQPTGDAVFDGDQGGAAASGTNGLARRDVAATAAALYVNSEQRRRGAGAARAASGYVRYGNFTEVMASSVDFLFPRRSQLVVEARAQEARANRSLAVRSLYDAELGESAYVASFHAHLSAEPNVPRDYFGLASINTIAKMHTGTGNNASPATDTAASHSGGGGDGKSVRVYGKLSLATFDAASQQMFEAATFDATSVHLRAPSVFVARNAFVGGHLYFSMHDFDFEAAAAAAAATTTTAPIGAGTAATVAAGNSSAIDAAKKRSLPNGGGGGAQHSVYMPLVGVSNDIAGDTSAFVTGGEHRDYGVVAQHANRVTTASKNAGATKAAGGRRVEYAVTLGNGDIEHTNVLSARSIVLGTLEATLAPTPPHAANGTAQQHRHHRRRYALSMVHSADGVHCERPLYVREPVRRAYTDATRATLLSDDAWHAQHGDDALRAIEALPVHRYRSRDTGREHVGLLAQHVQRTLPDAVIADARAPTAHVRVVGGGTASAAADFEVVLDTAAALAVDGDAVVAYLVMAMQEQQRRIVRLERALDAQR